MKSQVTPATEVWDNLRAAARTPEQHACRLAAEQTEPVPPVRDDGHFSRLVDMYVRHLQDEKFAYLNEHPATTMHAVELTRIADAGEQGLYARHLDGTTRARMLRRGWITSTSHDGRQAGARDWAAWLHITVEGRAVAAAALSNPVDLNDAQAAPLLMIRRAGEDGYTGWWPGVHGAYQVATFFRLVVERRPYKDAAPDWFVLTEAGKTALERWRAKPRRVKPPTPPQAQLLGELIEGQTARRTRVYRTDTYDACEVAGWLVWGAAKGDGSREAIITATGREAHAAFVAAPERARRARPELVPVRKLVKGQVVRLANRGGYRNLGPAWVTVVEVRQVPRIGYKPGGWQVLIEDGDGLVPYAGKTFMSVTKFQVKTSE